MTSGLRRRIRLGRPVWLGYAARLEQRYPSLTGNRQTEVVIVGGGMTGALLAQAFAAADVPVAVLEGALVGSGSTAASSALLLQEPDLGLVELEQRYGRRRSRRLWQLSHQAVHDLIGLLNRLRIGCDLKKRDSVHYATRAETVERLHREFVRRAKAGFEGWWLTPGDLRRMTGIPGRGTSTRGAS